MLRSHFIKSKPRTKRNVFRNGMILRATLATYSAHRVNRSMARRLQAAALASPFCTPAPPMTRTATAQATEETRKLRELLQVVLVLASVFRRLLQRLGGGRRNGPVLKVLSCQLLVPSPTTGGWQFFVPLRPRLLVCNAR